MADDHPVPGGAAVSIRIAARRAAAAPAVPPLPAAAMGGVRSNASGISSHALGQACAR